MECLLEVKNNYNFGEFVKRAKNYIVVPTYISYAVFFFTIYAIIHIIIGIIFDIYSIVIMPLIFLILIYGVYFYGANRNTKKILDLYGNGTAYYYLKFYDEYLEVQNKDKKGDRFNYDAFKKIAQTDIEYILFTEENIYFTVPKNITEAEKEIFFNIVNKRMKLKKLSKID